MAGLLFQYIFASVIHNEMCFTNKKVIKTIKTMALFNFLSKKKENRNSIPLQLAVDSPEPSIEEVSNVAPVVEDVTSENKPLVV